MPAVDTSDGYTDIPSGKIASVVTHLEMLLLPRARAERSEASWVLRSVRYAQAEQYRNLFRRVGENWLWCSRLQMTDADLLAILDHPLNEVHVLTANGQGKGFAELNFRTEGECELSFFGLTPEMIGQGAGRWMMNRVLRLAWERPILRLSLQTCTYDHPVALEFYMRSGFVPYKRQVQVVDDPRLTGLLPRDAAAQVALL